MTCQWCQEEEDIIQLCEFEDHTICNNCYSKYHKNYPKRMKGCPYCKGTEEVLVITQPLINHIQVSSSSNRETSDDQCARTCSFCCSVTCFGLIAYKIIYPIFMTI